jgi:succinoglycan biosynthesis transport protein ExoP
MRPGEDSQSNLGHYLEVLRRRKWRIVLAGLLATATALGLSALQTPVYVARAEVLLQARPSETLFDDRGPASDAGQLVNDLQTEIRVLKSGPVRAAVRKKLGRAPKVSAHAVPDTKIFEVESRDTDPEQAARIANTYVRSYIDLKRRQAVDDLLGAAGEVQRRIDGLQAEIDTITSTIVNGSAGNQSALDETLRPRRDALVGQQTLFRQRLEQLQVDAARRSGGAQLISPATRQRQAAEPKPVANGIMGLGLGLLLGLGSVAVAESLGNTVTTKEDIERVTPGIPCIGLIPEVDGWSHTSNPQLVSRSAPLSPAAEAYRSLRTSINFVRRTHRPIRTLQITSPSSSEGKSATVANLAVALSRTGEHVIVVDSDLRRPRLHEFFQLSNTVGLTDVLVGEAPLPAVLQRVPGENNLLFIGSGPLPPNPSELLSIPQAAKVVVALKAQADMVLFDSPPVLLITDAVVLSSLIDATLLLARAGKTSTKELARAADVLSQVGAPLVGTVLNGAEADARYGYGYEQAPPVDGRRRGRKHSGAASPGDDHQGSVTPTVQTVAPSGATVASTGAHRDGPPSKNGRRRGGNHEAETEGRRKRGRGRSRS